MARERLDRALELRGLTPSRARARDAILRGTVSVNGALATRPHQMVDSTDRVAISDPANDYVARSALKLIAGLDEAGVSPAGTACLDVGASTGGFTEVLLVRGAARVYAVDVGHGQLHERIRRDPRVVNLEGINARNLTERDIPEPIGLVTCDVSFVSATKVLAAPLRLCRSGAGAVVLVKPQFEVGPERVKRGGIVTDPAAIADAAMVVHDFMAQEGWRHIVSVPSPITGGDGNRETVAVYSKS